MRPGLTLHETIATVGELEVTRKRQALAKKYGSRVVYYRRPDRHTDFYLTGPKK